MAVGDQLDITLRIQGWLPTRWFPLGPGTRVWRTISGHAAALAKIYQQITYADLQSRLATATDAFLDLAVSDYLGDTLPRRLNEPDAAYSLRARKEIIRPRNTRAAIIQVLQDLTGNTPTVFRPSNAADTGGWSTGAMGYGLAGGYGSLALPFQAFVTIERGTASGAGVTATLPYPAGGYGSPLGGYGVGLTAWSDVGSAQAGVTDDDIYASVASVTPAGHINWVRITGSDPLPLPGFVPGQTVFPFFFAR